MKEQAFQFGNHNHISGIITRPEQTNGRPRPGVLLLNPGLIHRVGPSRLYVKIARRLAAAGYTVLRFDFSNVGDTPKRRDTLSFEESSILETQEAMDFITEAGGGEQFVLAGIYSGADVSFFTAIADPRVIGIVPMDLCNIPSSRFQLSAYKQRLFKPRSWLRLVSASSDIRNLLESAKSRIYAMKWNGRNAEMQSSGLEVDELEAFAANFRQLVEQQVQGLLIYTAENSLVLRDSCHQ